MRVEVQNAASSVFGRFGFELVEEGLGDRFSVTLDGIRFATASNWRGDGWSVNFLSLKRWFENLEELEEALLRLRPQIELAKRLFRQLVSVGFKPWTFAVGSLLVLEENGEQITVEMTGEIIVWGSGGQRLFPLTVRGVAEVLAFLELQIDSER